MDDTTIHVSLSNKELDQLIDAMRFIQKEQAMAGVDTSEVRSLLDKLVAAWSR